METRKKITTIILILSASVYAHKMDRLLKIYNLGAYLTKTTDEHLNEYIADSDKRVKFLTNFTGSNGLAVSCKRNVLFTDPIYYAQAKKELKNYELMKSEEKTLEDFLDETLEDRIVGLNPRYFSSSDCNALNKKLKGKGIELVFIENDLVDRLWSHKNKRKYFEIYSIENIQLKQYFPKEFDHNTMMLDKENVNVNIVKLSYEEKIKKIKDLISEDEEIIFTEMDTIAWIFNLRGSDIPYNPVFYSYATISRNSVKLFINQKISLKNVEIHEYAGFEDYLKNINRKVVVSGDCNAYIGSLFDSFKRTDEVRNMQTIKTNEELEGFNLAYILESACLCEFFEYLEDTIEENKTEVYIYNKLKEIRKKFSGYKGLSFESVVGFGKNSAIISYLADETQIQKNGALLIDCGANFLFGTTDTSRTLYFGTPPKDFKENYTRVLKGQLRVMMNKFPHQVNGSSLDTLTRIDLWNVQENFRHGSGHGVGHFLCIHEYPPCITSNSEDKIIPSQLFSVEPGVYKENEYGIRLENLVFTKDIGNNFQSVENLTYVPYQQNLIEVNMLSTDEINFLNNLSIRIRNLLTPFLKEKSGFKYMMNNTEELSK